MIKCHWLVNMGPTDFEVIPPDACGAPTHELWVLEVYAPEIYTEVRDVYCSIITNGCDIAILRR